MGGWTRTRLAVVSLALAAGCAEGPLVARVPFEPNDRSVLVVIEQGASLEVHAADASSRSMAPILRTISGFGGSPPIRVSAILFERTLAELGLAAGLVAAPAPGEPARGLPPGYVVMETVIEGDVVAEWAKVESPRAAIRELQLPRTTSCRPLVPARYTLQGEQFSAGLFRLDGARALLIAYDTGFDEPRFYEVGLDGPRLVDGTIAGFSARFGAQSRDGRIWLAGGLPDLTPEIVVGTPAMGFAPLPRRASWARSVGVPATREEDRSELFLVDGTGTIERFADGRWDRLGQLPAAEATGNGGRLAWLGPDELLILGLDKRALFHVKAGVVTREQTPFQTELGNGDDTISEVAVVPGVGTFAGLGSGYILERRRSGWALFSSPILAQHTITGFAPFYDGMLVGGDTGSIQQWYPGEGFCETLFLGNDVDVRELVQLDGGLVVMGLQGIGSARTQIYVATLREE